MNIHTIACQERRTNQKPVAYEMRYTEDEMHEVFTKDELTKLATGRVVNRGDVRMVDATVLAQVLLNTSFGD